MTACVTFETVKISDPVKFYDAEIVHLIHYIKDRESEPGKIYEEFYKEVCTQIESNAAKIVEHICRIDDFIDQLKTLMKIMETEYKEHPNSDVFVNLSAGSSEYIAAATIVSMMFENAIPFSVRNRSYTTAVDKIRELYYDENGHPIGLTSSTYDPQSIPKISIPVPDERLVRGLRIYIESDMKTSNVIKKLKESDLWSRIVSDCETAQTIERVYYHRDFVDQWIKNDWVSKDRFRNRYVLTDLGRRVLDIFYQD